MKYFEEVQNYIYILLYFYFKIKIWLHFFQRDDEVDVRLLIHQSLAGCVIGKGGQKIKEIRDVSTFLHICIDRKDVLKLKYKAFDRSLWFIRLLYFIITRNYYENYFLRFILHVVELYLFSF